MYCQYCGRQIADDARFCPRCGRAVADESDGDLAKPNAAQRSQPIQGFPQSIAQPSSVDRGVLISYLYSLRTMEFSVDRLQKDLMTLDYRISRLGIPREIYMNTKVRADYGGAFAGIVWGVILAVVGSVVYYILDWGLFNLVKFAGFAIIAWSLIHLLVSASNASEKNDNNQTAYRKAIEEDKARVERELQEKHELQQARPAYEQRLRQAMNLRQRAYNVNLIPQQMRNIWAIYYLYDFVSTSQAGLESAMLHFDLNEIKSRLDTVIQQQEDMILMQAQQLAQNERIIEQNDQLLQRAIATEKNTARAAQYAEISASNTEITAFTNTVMASIMLRNM